MVVVGADPQEVAAGGRVVDAKAAPKPRAVCVRVGAKATDGVSGRGLVCVQTKVRGLRWRFAPTAVTTTTTSVAPSTTVAVVPTVSLAATFIDSGKFPKAAVVTANVAGTVYFIEGASPVSTVSDITSTRYYRWTSGVVTANTPTSIALDVDVLTNGYYRVFVANSQGVLSAPAFNKVTISISRVSDVAVTTTTVALTCAAGGACAIGDTGPGGGVVYILSTTSGNTTGLTFEAARNDWNGSSPDGTAKWCGAGTAISGLGTAIGTGSSNSSTLAAGCSSTGTDDAAEYVRGKTIGGKTDWFLPSRDEALEIYTQRSVFTGNYAINQLTVDSARYLTSTQGTNSANALGAYLQGSGFPGTSQDLSKTFGFSIRPVRSFTAGS
jgi:hypothetical protein